MKGYMFEGGEFIDDSNQHDVSEWTLEGVTDAFIRYLGEDWADEITDMYRGGDRAMRDTVEIVNDRIAQATTCPVDGGMTYLILVE